MLIRILKWSGLILTIAVIFDFGLSLGATCPTHQPPSPSAGAENQPQKHCSIKESTAYAAASGFVHFVESGEHFLVAVSTVVIAIFTIVLGIATHLLWKATNALVASGEKTAIRQLRAYVTVDAVPNSTITFDKDSISFDLRAVNCGQTPAYKLMQLTATVILAPPLRVFPKKTQKIRSSPKTTLGPGQDHGIPVVKPITPTEREGLLAQKRRLYIWGSVYYVDTFKRASHAFLLLARYRRRRLYPSPSQQHWQ
jgi:hypothetical protein